MNIPAGLNPAQGPRPSGSARGYLRIAAIVSAVLASIWSVMGLVFDYIFAGIGGIFAVLGSLWLAFLFFARKCRRKKARNHATVI